MIKPHVKQPQIYSSGFDFLDTLKNNNNREWFNMHKAEFKEELTLVEVFAEALLQDLNTHDVIETPSGKKSLYRIYRDTRFSAQKTPYKTHWSGSFKRAAKYRRGGYYFHLESSGNSFIAGGFWGPAAQDLQRIREEIALDAMPLREILSSGPFVSTFETLAGEQLKTAPRGFHPGHENIDLLRYKQFLLIRRFSDKEVLNEDFLKEAGQTFKNMRPFFDYMSEILTTDMNGLEI